MAAVERETKAMRDVAKALQGLSTEQRGRVMTWAMANYSEALAAYLDDRYEAAE
jgi:predicted unusual protein kinase regulating ubiquinone biosynthesis (AarF/ABC1/UbiB family)